MDIFHIQKGYFFAIGGALNERQGVPWPGKVSKSSYLVKFGHELFLVEPGAKLTKCERLDLRIC